MRTATATTPEQAIELFSERLSAGDLDGALALYEPDAAFAPEPGMIVTGTAEIRDALGRFVALDPRISGQIEKVVQTADAALVVNRWSLRGTAPEGGPISIEGTSTDVLRRQPDGRWLIVIDDPWGA